MVGKVRASDERGAADQQWMQRRPDRRTGPHVTGTCNQKTLFSPTVLRVLYTLWGRPT